MIARIEALVGATPSVPAPAPASAPVAVPAGARDYDEDFGEEYPDARGGVTDSIVLVVVDGEDERDALSGGIAFEEV